MAAVSAAAAGRAPSQEEWRNRRARACEHHVSLAEADHLERISNAMRAARARRRRGVARAH